MTICNSKMIFTLLLASILFSSSEASTLKFKETAITNEIKQNEIRISEDIQEIEFPKSSDQNFRVPRAISYGWTKDDCEKEANKSPCNKCKCGKDDCMVLSETCAETVCPLVEDLPEDVGLCCPICPTYGDGSLESLKEECERRELEKAEESGQLCPGVCSCTEKGPFVVCDVRQVQMCERECLAKYGSDPCAKCECEESGSCSLVMQVQSEPFCGEGISPIEKEGQCGLTCPN